MVHEYKREEITVWGNAGLRITNKCYKEVREKLNRSSGAGKWLSGFSSLLSAQMCSLATTGHELLIGFFSYKYISLTNKYNNVWSSLLPFLYRLIFQFCKT